MNPASHLSAIFILTVCLFVGQSASAAEATFTACLHGDEAACAQISKTVGLPEQLQETLRHSRLMARMHQACLAGNRLACDRILEDPKTPEQLREKIQQSFNRSASLPDKSAQGCLGGDQAACKTLLQACSAGDLASCNTLRDNALKSAEKHWGPNWQDLSVDDDLIKSFVAHPEKDATFDTECFIGWWSADFAGNAQANDKSKSRFGVNDPTKYSGLFELRILSDGSITSRHRRYQETLFYKYTYDGETEGTWELLRPGVIRIDWTNVDVERRFRSEGFVDGRLQKDKYLHTEQGTGRFFPKKGIYEYSCRPGAKLTLGGWLRYKKFDPADVAKRANQGEPDQEDDCTDTGYVMWDGSYHECLGVCNAKNREWVFKEFVNAGTYYEMANFPRELLDNARSFVERIRSCDPRLMLDLARMVVTGPEIPNPFELYESVRDAIDQNWELAKQTMDCHPAVSGWAAGRLFGRVMRELYAAAGMKALAGPGMTSRVQSMAEPKGVNKTQCNMPRGDSVGAMRRAEYAPSPKHGSSSRQGPKGIVSRAPTNGQAALDTAVDVGNGPRRIGIDYETGEFVVFDQTNNVSSATPEFHGHVRTWNELDPRMRSSLIKARMVDSRGRILSD